MPAGSVTVHHLDSHDTFWWGEKARFRREALGTDAAQALFALCATLDGAVMSYVGAERGSEGFYQRILRLRRDISELRWGDCDYLQDACDDPMVLLLWRQWQGQHTLVLVNLADRDSVTEVRLPLSLSGLRVDQLYTIWDAFAGQLMHSGPPAPLTATLPRYGVAVWVIRPQ